METTVAARPEELIWSITNSVVTSRALHLVAELGVADCVDDQPMRFAELAGRCRVDSTALERVLRLLAGHGIFSIAGDRVGNTDASLLLRETTPGSLRDFARMMALPAMWTAIGALDHSVRTGRPAMEVVDPGGFFGHLAHEPYDAAIFNAAMRGRGHAFARAVVQAYDFTPFTRIVDVAGGHGHLLRAVLDAVPHAEGVLFELPPVAAVTAPDPRITTIGADFFVDALPPGDAYLLMEILHDWSDDQAVDILTAIRRACRTGAVVLVIENVVPDGAPDPRVHNLDLIMLIMTGGRERTTAELRRLFERAGFQLTAVTETASPMRIAEAVAI
jgi:C-methyltransferase